LDRVRFEGDGLKAQLAGAADVAFESEVERRLAARDDQPPRSRRVEVLDPDQGLFRTEAPPIAVLPTDAAVLVAVESGSDEPLPGGAGDELSIERERHSDWQFGQLPAHQQRALPLLVGDRVAQPLCHRL
jgi:hypothetical protein